MQKIPKELTQAIHDVAEIAEWNEQSLALIKQAAANSHAHALSMLLSKQKEINTLLLLAIACFLADDYEEAYKIIARIKRHAVPLGAKA